MGDAGGLISLLDAVPAPPGALLDEAGVWDGTISLLDPAPAPPAALLDEPGIAEEAIALLDPAPAPPADEEIGVGPPFGGADREIEPTVIGGKEKAGKFAAQ